jgi:hypothetical protein
MGNNPGQTGGFVLSLSTAAVAGIIGLEGLPSHLRVIDSKGKSRNTLRRQFSKGKASKKKRGK